MSVGSGSSSSSLVRCLASNGLLVVTVFYLSQWISPRPSCFTAEDAVLPTSVTTKTVTHEEADVGFPTRCDLGKGLHLRRRRGRNGTLQKVAPRSHELNSSDSASRPDGRAKLLLRFRG